MAWLSKTFTAIDNKPIWSDLNHLLADIKVWGGDVDAGGHALNNVGALNWAGGAVLTLGAGAALTIGTSGSLNLGTNATLNFGTGAVVSGVLPISVPFSGAFPPVILFDGSGAGIGTGQSIQWAVSGTNYLRIRSGITGAAQVAMLFDTAMTERMRITYDGKVGIGVLTPHATLAVSGLQSYANNTAALAGGLAANDLYLVSSSNPRQVAIVF